MDRCWERNSNRLCHCRLAPSPNIALIPTPMTTFKQFCTFVIIDQIYFSTGFWTPTYMTPVFSNERCLRLHDAFIASMKMTVFIWKRNWNNSMGSFSYFVRAQFSMTINFYPNMVCGAKNIFPLIYMSLPVPKFILFQANISQECPGTQPGWNTARLLEGLNETKPQE